MQNRQSSEKTLLLSVLMSAPGPIILGFALLSGKSSTQIADFIRRTAELIGLAAAFFTYRKTNNGTYEKDEKEHLERRSNVIVGTMMCVGGIFMVILTFLSDNQDKGNVVPSLCIAALGLIANTLFWIKYTKLNRTSPNAIIEVNARLYRAKSLVDFAVTSALLSVALMPGTVISYYLDAVGSVLVAVYLFNVFLSWLGMLFPFLVAHTSWKINVSGLKYILIKVVIERSPAHRDFIFVDSKYVAERLAFKDQWGY